MTSINDLEKNAGIILSQNRLRNLGPAVSLGESAELATVADQNLAMTIGAKSRRGAWLARKTVVQFS
jgi:hypothetical protein